MVSVSNSMLKKAKVEPNDEMCFMHFSAPCNYSEANASWKVAHSLVESRTPNAKIDGSPELLYHAILLPLYHIIFITVPDDLPSPDDHDLTLLLATVIVAARPAHLMATLNYADLFAWSVPIDMM